MIVLVCGGRDYGDITKLNQVLDALHIKTPITCVVNGGARGADRYATWWADEKDIAVRVYPADWDKYGEGAGPVRNQQMLDSEKIELVVAFPGGKGTADMVRRSKIAGLKVFQA